MAKKKEEKIKVEPVEEVEEVVEEQPVEEKVVVIERSKVFMVFNVE